MVVSVSRLRAAGIAKESTDGTPVTTPTRYLNIIPPDSFTPMIQPLPSKGIEAIADMYPKITQGPGTLNGMKVKLEVEPDNLGEILQATFGLDTKYVITTSIIIIAGYNDAIDFTHSGTFVAKIPAGVYAVAALETAIAAAMNAADSNSYTCTLSTGKIQIAGTGAFVLKFGTGANLATSAGPTLGFAASDTGSATTQTAGSAYVVAGYTSHVFQRQNVSALPTLTWWFDKALKYPLFAGCMVNKLDLNLKAKGIFEADAEFVGIVYDDVDGIAESTAFNALKPFVWSNAVVKIDGAVKSGYDNMKLSLDNSVKADHALNNSIWPYTNYSEGFTPELSMELFFEDTTQYAKFLAGTTAHVNIDLTVTQNNLPYRFNIDIPVWYYKSANLYIPSNGPLKIPFTGMCQPGGNNYSVQILLGNDVTTQY